MVASVGINKRPKILRKAKSGSKGSKAFPRDVSSTPASAPRELLAHETTRGRSRAHHPRASSRVKFVSDKSIKLRPDRKGLSRTAATLNFSQQRACVCAEVPSHHWRQSVEITLKWRSQFSKALKACSRKLMSLFRKLFITAAVLSAFAVSPGCFMLTKNPLCLQ